MSYKIGGGNHLQHYDDRDGEYDNISAEKMNQEDKKHLMMFYYFNVKTSKVVFHWPLEGVHDEEYCDLFVKFARKYIKETKTDVNKAKYLLTFSRCNDKSKCLNDMGYNINNPDLLKKDIDNYTSISTLTFSRYEHGCLKCVAKTILKGNVVTSVWELQKDFSLRFITLIPKGEKRWK